MEKKLNDTQEYILSVLNSVIKATNEMNVKCYMQGGTMLGAIRHGGFIPWDDDVDLGIMRNEYEIFLKNVKKYLPENLELRTYWDESDHHYYFARIVDKRYLIKRMGSAEIRYENVWVDIFPLDGMPSNIFALKVHQFRLALARLMYHLSCIKKVNIKRPGRWDDDIDIAMPRRDFEKLYKIIKKQYSFKYSMLHPQDKENYGRILPKIRLKGTGYKTILEYDLNESGIFIDIYTIENIPDSKMKKWGQGIICMFMGFALSCRRMAKGYKIFKNYQNGISFKVKALIGCILSFGSIEKWAIWTDYWYSWCKDENSKYVGIPADDFHYFGEIYKRSEFCNYKEIKFEGRNCLIPSNYDAYLKRRYGEYMTPPDIDHHDRNCYLVYNLGKYEKEI